MIKAKAQTSAAIAGQTFFKTDHLQKDLKKKSVRGGAITMVAQAMKFMLQMCSTIVLARLLTPDDYGLIGMVTVVIKFVVLFKDLGLSTATIQRANINHKQVSTLFWINIAFGIFVALLVAGLSPLIAWFYKEPRLINITTALAFIFICRALSVQHEALLKRQMMFNILAKIDVLSMLSAVVIAIITATQGSGYWSIVYMLLMMSTVNTIGVWIACPWRPGLPRRNANVRSMLAFGSNLTGFKIANYLSLNLDNILIGRLWGTVALGLYAKAYQLVLLPMDQINAPLTTIALPALSRITEDQEKYQNYYYKAVLSVTSIGMPLVGYMFATADQLIPFVLGDKWSDAVPIFLFLAIPAFLGTLEPAMAWAYQSLGRADRQFRSGLVISILTAIAFVIGVRWGAIGVAAALGITRPLIIIPSLIYCYRNTPLSLQGLFLSIYRPALASISAALIIYLLNRASILTGSIFINLVINLIAYIIFYAAIWVIIPNGRKIIRELL